MGTRSLLAFDTGRGDFYVQYLQFDGYPRVKGCEYYNAILRGLDALGSAAVGKSGRPNTKFFKMVKHFLDHYQYESGHSAGNHFKGSPDEFWKSLRDSWEEWKYIWMRNGDFVFFNVYDDTSAMTYVIPWEFTWNLSRANELSRDVRGHLNDNGGILDKGFWESFDKYDDVGYPKPPATLSLEVGKALAFDITKNDTGYRSYAVLGLDDKVIKKDMFADRPEKKDVEVFKTYHFPFRGLYGLMTLPGVSSVPDAFEYLSNKDNLPTLIGLDPSMDVWLEGQLKAA